MKKVCMAAVILGVAFSVAPARSHEHHAPHKGTLIEFGEEFAHLELVIDQASGKITAYVLDGEAEKAVRVAQGTVEISVPKTDKTDAFTITLKAQASALSGEKEGDTSEF